MKDIYQLLRQKEMDLARLREDIENLRIVILSRMQRKPPQAVTLKDEERARGHRRLSRN